MLNHNKDKQLFAMKAKNFINRFMENLKKRGDFYQMLVESIGNFIKFEIVLRRSEELRYYIQGRRRFLRGKICSCSCTAHAL